MLFFPIPDKLIYGLPPMIPLRKLSELPRSQRLRKVAKLFEDAEKRFALSETLPGGEAECLGRVAGLLAEDENFSDAAMAALRAAQTCLAAASAKTYAEAIAGVGKSTGEIRRSLNTVFHILLAETGRNQADWDFIESSGALDPSKRRPFSGMQVYFEDIRSPFNVGSMFRAAESFGAEKVWLSPLCADPRHKRAERTAMGCVDVLPWERLPHDPFASDTADQKKTEACGSGFLQGPFFALETGGTSIGDFSFPSRGILIAGSEELGVSPRALAAADASLGRVTIPTYGAKGSLNVSVAFGIVMQAWASRLAINPPIGYS